MKIEDFFQPGSNFLGLPEKDSNFDNSRYIILPVPYDATTTYVPGTRFGPEAIINASRMVELYDEDLEIEPYKEGIYTFPPVVVSAGGPEAMGKTLEEIISLVAKTKKFLIVLGGEHSITFPVVRTLKSIEKENFGVLQFDAHADLRNEYESTPYSHACVMKRISELNIPIFQVGIRSISAEELPMLKKKSIKTYWMRDIVDLAPEAVVSNLIKELPPSIYITIDLDVFDPSLMPAVGTPEPGGLNWYEVLDILKQVFQKKTVIAFDVVELCPLKNSIYSDFTAAKLIYRLMGYFNK